MFYHCTAASTATQLIDITYMYCFCWFRGRIRGMPSIVDTALLDEWETLVVTRYIL